MICAPPDCLREIREIRVRLLNFGANEGKVTSLWGRTLSAIQRFYRLAGEGFENCYYVEVSEPLVPSDLPVLKWLLAETFEADHLGEATFLKPADGEPLEVGPRLNFETAFSTNAVAICRYCGLPKVSRLEKSRRWTLPEGANRIGFAAARHDRMSECR